MLKKQSYQQRATLFGAIAAGLVSCASLMSCPAAKAAQRGARDSSPLVTTPEASAPHIFSQHSVVAPPFKFDELAEAAKRLDSLPATTAARARSRSHRYETHFHKPRLGKRKRPRLGETLSNYLSWIPGISARVRSQPIQNPCPAPPCSSRPHSKPFAPANGDHYFTDNEAVPSKKAK